MEQLGISFDIIVKPVEEDGPEFGTGEELACYLSELKSRAFSAELEEPENIVVTADTVVWLGNESLAKPGGQEEASEMLKKLSGKKHQVITGVTIASGKKKHTFCATTDVWFKELSDGEIDHYVREFKPFDKAGAYGVQEWIGLTGITRIEGSYYNVVGLPVQKVYTELLKFLNE